MFDILINDDDKFHNDYNDWRVNRVKKMIQILSEEWFKGKTVVELACGQGNISKFFKSLGANVIATDAREEHLKDLKNIKTLQIDQDSVWGLDKKADLIIHFGVLYHLKNWKQDLECAINNSSMMFLETVVADTDDPYFEHEIEEEPEGGQNAYNSVGTVMSAANVERVLDELGCKFNRYDDADLSTPGRKLYQYDWIVTNNIEGYENAKSFEDKPLYGGRRFWLVYPPPTVS